MISRYSYLDAISEGLKRSPIVALLGPRQAGKTTLARMYIEGKKATLFDLESQPDVQRLQNPELVLGSLEGLVILDEIQLMPDLFAVLRVLVDRPGNETKYLILGSASPTIIKSVSETLAGRVEFVDLAGFDLAEVGVEYWEKLWLRGGFPRSFLAENEEDSLAWREAFIRTFLERDIPQLGITIPSTAMRRFWTMLAHYHGQTWNASELARSMGISDKTVRSYLDILSGTFMVRQLQPWYENISKRQVKSPKIYLRDSGLLHALLNLPERLDLLGHPKVGASWEGFALEQTILALQPPEVFFWSTYREGELDLFFLHAGKRYGIEAKFTEAPKVIQSMRFSLTTLGLEHLWVIYPGSHQYPVDEKITIWPVDRIPQLAQQFSLP
jgi:predicted AAA+ superfamily ATPase